MDASGAEKIKPYKNVPPWKSTNRCNEAESYRDCGSLLAMSSLMNSFRLENGFHILLKLT